MPVSAGKALTDQLYVIHTYSVYVHRVFASSGQSGQEGIFITVNSEFRYPSPLFIAGLRLYPEGKVLPFIGL